jgi:type IV pilus assembly protein PilA
MFKRLNLKKREGFTLIELMIVVAIIGILAAIAIPNFLRFQLRAKAGEGKVNLAAIRTAEEGFFAEFSTYIAASTLSPVPEANVGISKNPWTDNGGFGDMGFAPEGDVYYTYGVEVGANASAPGNDRFTATAISNIDGAGAVNVWGYVKPNAGGTAIAGTLASAGNCPATGTYDVATATNTLLQVVGPCGSGMGQSIF